jgi:predicted HAD superfamily Cof-like phosphohydrolase
MERVVGMVAEFTQAFEASKDPDLWLGLVEEEVAEVEQAAADLLKEICDLAYVLAGLALLDGAPDANQDARIDATEDRIDAVRKLVTDWFEPVLHEAFRRVHESNMSKLGPDGKPIRREDGKILKGPNYREPVLIDLIRGG